MSTKVADSVASELEALFLQRNDIVNRWGNIISSYQALPGLVGFWPMSSVQRSTGNVYDLSGQSRTLTYNGNPTFNIYNGLVPYIDLDGVGDFLSRADETDLDILGTETIYAGAVRGLTVGGWFWLDALGADRPFMSKFNTVGNQRSYVLVYNNATAIYQGLVSVDGVNTTAVDSTATPSTGIWLFSVLRFTPSTEIAIFINKTKNTNTVGIPASIFNSTSAFQIGSSSAAAVILDGRSSLCFLCANALPDALITSLYEQARLLFGQ